MYFAKWLSEQKRFLAEAIDKMKHMFYVQCIFRLNLTVVCSSEVLVSAYQTRRCHNPDNHIPQDSLFTQDPD
jgi:hypothetical protein